MTQDSDCNRLYGIYMLGSRESYQHQRDQGCVLHEVNIAERTLNRKVDVHVPYETFLLAHNPSDDSVLLGGKLKNEEKYEIRRMGW